MFAVSNPEKYFLGQSEKEISAIQTGMLEVERPLFDEQAKHFKRLFDTFLIKINDFKRDFSFFKWFGLRILWIFTLGLFKSQYLRDYEERVSMLQSEKEILDAARNAMDNEKFLGYGQLFRESAETRASAEEGSNRFLSFMPAWRFMLKGQEKNPLLKEHTGESLIQALKEQDGTVSMSLEQYLTVSTLDEVDDFHCHSQLAREGYWPSRLKLISYFLRAMTTSGSAAPVDEDHQLGYLLYTKFQEQAWRDEIIGYWNTLLIANVDAAIFYQQDFEKVLEDYYDYVIRMSQEFHLPVHAVDEELAYCFEALSVRVQMSQGQDLKGIREKHQKLERLKFARERLSVLRDLNRSLTKGVGEHLVRGESQFSICSRASYQPGNNRGEEDDDESYLSEGEENDLLKSPRLKGCERECDAVSLDFFSPRKPATNTGGSPITSYSAEFFSTTGAIIRDGSGPEGQPNHTAKGPGEVSDVPDSQILAK